jgi:hypothetical protein
LHAGQHGAGVSAQACSSVLPSRIPFRMQVRGCVCSLGSMRAVWHETGARTRGNRGQHGSTQALQGGASCRGAAQNSIWVMSLNLRCGPMARWASCSRRSSSMHSGPSIAATWVASIFCVAFRTCRCSSAAISWLRRSCLRVQGMSARQAASGSQNAWDHPLVAVVLGGHRQANSQSLIVVEARTGSYSM